MKIIISPAKKLNETKYNIKDVTSIPFSSDSQCLINELKSYSVDKLMSLMNVSQSIANLNHNRFNQWSYPFDESSSKPAIYMFDGAVYNALDVSTFDADDLAYSQDNLRILSGLYGLLKPLDLIMPYRLEMGTKLHFNGFSSLYKFWGDKITNCLVKDSNLNNPLINLASNEYSKAVDLKKFNNVITPVFKDFKNGKFKVISFFAKKARGAFARFVIKNKPKSIDDLTLFNDLGYVFSQHDSNNQLIFTR